MESSLAVGTNHIHNPLSAGDFCVVALWVSCSTSSNTQVSNRMFKSTLPSSPAQRRSKGWSLTANTYDGAGFGSRVATSKYIRCKCFTLIGKCAHVCMGASTFLACRVVDVGWSQVRRVYRFYSNETARCYGM
jgi:hypothetical protein